MIKRNVLVATLASACLAVAGLGVTTSALADDGSTVLGALVGAGVGSAIGHNMGRGGGTVGGVIGAMVGASIANANEGRYYGPPQQVAVVPAYNRGYYAPQPPVYYAPAPVVYRPAVAYVERDYRPHYGEWRQREWHEHEWREHESREHDGRNWHGSHRD